MAFSFPWLWRRPPFAFRNPGILRDEELELIPPSSEYAGACLIAAQHPLTLRTSPDLYISSRKQLDDYVRRAPGGHEEPSPGSGRVPSYRFWMLDRSRRDLPIAGGIVLRIGHTVDLERYYGHVGYHVYPTHRAHHLAERSVRLLLPLARSHGLAPLWITCNPDNLASRRTCERAGGELVDVVAVPAGHPLHALGETEKCRYRFELGKS